MWHDHSEISGHSHFLVLVSAVYDPAFYLTPTELDNKGDITGYSVVEEPEIHILARSASLLQDQQLCSECRKEYINKLDQDLHTQQGTPVHDVVRFFMGMVLLNNLKQGIKLVDTTLALPVMRKAHALTNSLIVFVRIVSHWKIVSSLY